MITITVYGQPAPQGSKKFMGIKGGKGIMVESSKAVKPWREAVLNAALDRRLEMDSGPLRGPLSVEMIFTLRKPASAPKKRKSYPDKKPDLSKLVRSTEDALTNSCIWEDDARVISCLARKVFPDEDPDALSALGAIIRIRQVAS